MRELFMQDGSNMKRSSLDVITGEITESQLSQEEIDKGVEADKLAFDALNYAEKRASKYPPLTEQLDLLWHAIDAGTLDDRDHRNKFYSMLKQVKENNPKG